MKPPASTEEIWPSGVAGVLREVHKAAEEGESQVNTAL